MQQHFKRFLFRTFGVTGAMESNRLRCLNPIFKYIRAGGKLVSSVGRNVKLVPPPFPTHLLGLGRRLAAVYRKASHFSARHIRYLPLSHERFLLSFLFCCSPNNCRYIAIVHPLRHRTSRKKARIFLLIIWALSCVLAAPCLMYSTVMTKR